MYFVTQAIASSTTTVMWLVRWRIGATRPRAFGRKRFSVRASPAYARLMRSSPVSSA